MKTKLLIFLTLIAFQNISGQITYGSVSASQTICNGTEPNTLNANNRVQRKNPDGTITNSTATLTRWQQSTNGGSTWVNAAGTNNTTVYKPGILTQTTHYRVYLESSLGNGYSNEVIITVSSEQNAGTINEGQTICKGTAAPIISCSAATGGLETYTYLWQQSTNGGSTWANAAGTNNGQNYSPGILNQTTHFRRMATNNCGTVISATAVMTMSSEQNAGIIGEGQTICYGTAAPIISCSAATGGLGTYTYLWQQSTNGGSTWANAAGTNNGQNYSPGILNQTTHFRRMGTNNCGTVISATAVMTVSPEQNAGTINEGQTICNGTAAAIISCSAATGGLGTYNYLWQQSTNGGSTWTNAAGENNSQNYNPGILNQTTRFRRVATNNCGTVISPTAVITMSSEQNAGTISEKQTICNGATAATISCSAATGGLGTYTYLWQQSTNGGSTWYNTVGTNNGQNYSPGILTQTTHFRRVATNNCGTVYSYAIEIEVYEKLVGSIIEKDQVICYGSLPNPIKINKLPTGGSGSYNYQWQQSYNSVTWNNIPGATNSYYEPTELIRNTYYRQVVQEQCGTKESNQILINVSDEFFPGKIGEDQLILYNTTPQRINVSIAPTGGSDINTYQWQRSTNGNTWINITGANSDSYQPGNLTQTTYFKRLTTNTLCGMKETNAVKINVVTEVIAGKIGESQTICMNAQANTITTIEPSSEGIGVYYVKWKKSTNGVDWTEIIGATGESYNPGRLTETTYFKKLITTDITGEIETNTVTITVLPKLEEITIGDNQQSCLNSIPNPLTIKTDVSGGDGFFNYQWQQSTNNAKWDDIFNATNKYYEPTTISSLTYFRLKISNICGSVYSNSVQIVVNDELISGNIEQSQSIKYNETPTKLIGEMPAGGTGTYVYQWQRSIDGVNWTNVINNGAEKDYQPTALTQTTYFKRVVSSGNCGNFQSNIIKITVQEEINPGNIGSNQTICYNGTAQAITGTEASGGNGTFSYKWQQSTNGINWVEINEGIGTSYVPRGVLVNTYYRRGATSEGVTKYTNSVLISVTSVVHKPITNEKKFYCTGDKASIEISNSIYEKYNWYNSDKMLVKVGLKLDKENLTETSVFYVEAEDSRGCKSEFNTVSLNVEKVVASFDAEVKKISLGYPVRFINKSENAETYAWDFCDRTDIIYERNPWHYYNEGSLTQSTWYDVELTAYSQNGCVDKKKITNMIEVLKYENNNGNQIISINGDKITVTPSDKQNGKETSLQIEDEIFVNNPVKDIMVITSKEKITKVLVYSMSGQLVKSSNEETVDLSAFNSGIYLVVVETENKNFKNIKIVKL